MITQMVETILKQVNLLKELLEDTKKQPLTLVALL
jgi:hypothetical protein